MAESWARIDEVTYTYMLASCRVLGSDRHARAASSFQLRVDRTTVEPMLAHEFDSSCSCRLVSAWE
jgi:hypothetical protein